MALYDAFISYSHAKDKPVASALQSVIQKLGKPWYRRRALRLFRDDTSLSATPHLWPTIEKALSESRFLLVLASPEAAASQWVNKEVAWWLEHKGIDTLLLAVVDGEIAWDNTRGDFTARASTPLPAVLAGRFTSEPKWVDLRAYRLSPDARNADFTSLAADFAAAIHGMPKEDLLSQEVRQQRRALTLAWSAVATLIVLIGVAAWQWWEADIAKKEAQTAAHIATEQRDRAERTLKAATSTANSLVNDLARQFRYRTGIPLSLVRDIVDRARNLQQQLTQSGETSPDLRRSEAMALAQVAITLIDQGDAVSGLAAAEQERDIMTALVSTNADDTEWQRAWAYAYRMVGNALGALGREPSTLEAYSNANEILTRLVSLDPGKAQWQNERAGILRQMADSLRAMGRSEEAIAALRQAVSISEKLVETDPANVDWQYGLADNRDGLGRALDAAGRLTEALTDLEEGLAIRQRLAAKHPQNGDYQNEVYRSFLSLADLYGHDEKMTQAIAVLQQGLAILEPIAARDPGNGLWQNNLSTLHQRLGDLYVREGNLEKAGEQFAQDLAIREKLAAANPERDEWQQYLANAYNRMGDIRLQDKNYEEALRWYRKALAIRERLAPTVAANADWQSLLAGEHVKIARALVQDGKKEEGAESYQKAVAIFQRLVELDPGKVSWEQMTTIALNEMAGLLAKIDGRMPDAIAALRQAVAIQVKLVAVNPDFMPRRWNLALTYETLGDLLLDTKQREEALASFVHASELLEQLASDDRDGLRSRRELSDVAAKAGSLMDSLGRRAEAIVFYRKCLAVREELAGIEPQETWWQIGAAVALIRLGELGDDPDPRFTRALAMLEGLDAAGKLPEQRKLWLDRARGKVALIHSRQARAALYAGDLSLALDEISIALKLDPSNAYSVLWRHIIRARRGDDDRAELAADAARLDSAIWPWPVVALFTGTKTPDLVRADALSGKDDKTRTGQICEADFYTGMFAVEKGATEEARQLLAAALKGCPPDFMEYEGARQELKRLGFAGADDSGQKTENR
jgi:tetratricopeptide (TPR) repeat protein